MKVKTICGPLSYSKLKRDGGGYSSFLKDEVDYDLNTFMDYCSKNNLIVHDIKVNHFTPHRHNNGGCDEVYVQYTIMYD